MAQTGYTPLLIYSSSTASNAPSAGNLTNSTVGSELAINIADGKLFYKDSANAVQVIAWKTTPTTAGGTGLTSYAAGDLLYYVSGTTLTRLAIGSNGNYLSSSGTAPQWSAPAALTKTDDTNVTLTLGGSASTALLNAASLTLGWTGQLAASRGGTGQGTYAVGDILYATGTTTLSKLAIGTNTQILTSTGTAPQWTNASSVSVGTASNLLSNSSTGVMQITGPAASSTRVMTIPDANFTAARTDAAQTFTGTQTVRAAATQDAVALAGRAGGTSSYVSTITPTTLTASRTVTLPNADTFLPVATQFLTFSGPTAARTITLPDANFTAARTDAAQTFSGEQTFSDNIKLSTSGKKIYQSATNADLTLSANGTGQVYVDGSNFQVSKAGGSNNAGPTTATIYGSTSSTTDGNKLVFNNVWNGVDYKTTIMAAPDATAGSASSSYKVTTQYFSSGVQTANVMEHLWFTIKMPLVYDATVGATNRDVYVDNTGVLGYVSSTRESKANIQPYDNCEWLRQLQPITFNRRNKEATQDLENYPNGYKYTDEICEETEIGLLADDVVKIAPDICFYDEMPDGSKKLSGIQYSKLVVPMLKYIQKLENRLAALEAK